MIRKNTAWILSVVLIISAVCLPNIAGADGDVVYNSFDAWPAEITADTTLTNDDPVWRWLYKNTQSGDEYIEMSITSTSGNAAHNEPPQNGDGTYDYAANATANVKLFADSASNASMRNFIGKWWMRPSVATGSEPKQSPVNRLVKQFTAPQSGTVSISATDMLGDSKIYNKKLTSANHAGAVVSVSKLDEDDHKTELWSHTFEFGQDGTDDDNGLASIDFEELVVHVDSGERLWFEVSAETGGSAYAKQVFWTPVVTYMADIPEVTATPEVTPTPEVTATPEITSTPEVTPTPEITSTPEVTATPEATSTPIATATPEVTSTPKVSDAPIIDAESVGVYCSRDAWQEAADGASISENTYNGHTEWTWEHKDSGNDWIEFAKFYSERSSFGMTPGNVTNNETRPAGKAWSTASGDWNHSAVGEGWMVPLMKTGNPDAAVSRTFTAPETGKIELSAEDGGIYGGSKQPTNAANKPACVRITKNGEQIWPEGNEGVRIPSDTEQKYEFDNISTEITKGDKLRFEVYNGDSSTQYAKITYWVPTVSYIYDKNVGIEPHTLSNVPVNQMFVLSFPEKIGKITKEDITISPSNNSETVKSLSQSDDGKKLTIDFNGLEKNSEYTVKIKNITPDGSNSRRICSFSFMTETYFENPVYESDAAWPDTLSASTMKNDDRVWQFLYKNNSTKDTLTPYVPYKLTAHTSTQSYAKPSVNSDGSYDYITTPTTSSSAEYLTGIYCDSQTNAYARNSIGRWWLRLAVATQSEPMQSKDNEIVKAFTAPQTGEVSISAKDLSGESKIYNKNVTEANKNGAVLRIIKKSADDKETELWSHTFQYTADSLPAGGLAIYDFEPIKAEINKGEQLWFVASGELGGSAYSKMVFWNPVVSYTDVFPDVVSMTPANNSKNLALNFEQTITFNYELADVLPSNVEIDGGASVSEISMSEDGMTVGIKFANLKANTKYNVKLKDIRIAAVAESRGGGCEFSFTTGATIQTGGIYLSGGTLKAGKNTICADINNALGAAGSVGAALMASVCKGTESNYEIVSTKTMYRNDIGENDNISVSVSLPDTNNYFIKAVLLDNVPSARALLPIKIFKK